MSLAEIQEARKARLIALRKRKEGEASDDGEASAVKGRNFDPETRTIRKHNPLEPLEDTVENNVEGLAEKIITEDEVRRAQELDIFNIAPKRPNWDLKRDLNKKLAKLERRTQEAIHTLIPSAGQRLAAQKGESDDLLGAMNAQAKQDTADTLSDEED
ncbi:hypothetical protein H0H93_012275 [Arthromyces matolae]|nr:hypothetical protein H0H93_012275 [Arthromyces matolae]